MKTNSHKITTENCFLNYPCNLPRTQWLEIFNHLTESELPRVTTCCHQFNELASASLITLYRREIDCQVNPLKHILESLVFCNSHNLDMSIKKFREFFKYCMENIVLTDDHFKEAFLDIEEHVKATLLALSDLTFSDLTPLNFSCTWLNNYEKLNNILSHNRSSYLYWNFLDSILTKEEFAKDTHTICCYFSLLENALKEEKYEKSVWSQTVNILRKIGEDPVWFSAGIQILLQNLLSKIAINNPNAFLRLIYNTNQNFTMFKLPKVSNSFKDKLLNLIDELSKSKDELTATLAVITAIEVRQHSYQALKDYLPLLPYTTKKKSSNFIANSLLLNILVNQRAIEDHQLILMKLMQQCLVVNDCHYHLCIDFARYIADCPDLPSSPVLKIRLSDLADIYLNSTDDSNIGYAIAVKLILAGCTDKAVCKYLPLCTPSETRFLALDAIVNRGKNLSPNTKAKVFELINEYAKIDDYLGEGLIHKFNCRYNVSTKSQKSVTMKNPSFVKAHKDSNNIQNIPKEEPKSELSSLQTEPNLSTIPMNGLNPYCLILFLIILATLLFYKPQSSFSTLNNCPY